MKKERSPRSGCPAMEKGPALGGSRTIWVGRGSGIPQAHGPQGAQQSHQHPIWSPQPESESWPRQPSPSLRHEACLCLTLRPHGL